MNKKAVAAFVIILILLLGVFYFTLLRNKSTGPTIIIIKNKPTTNNSISPSTNTITQITNKTPTPPSNTLTQPNTTPNKTMTTYCISSSGTVAIPNGNFGTGTYADWNITGQGFLNGSGKPVPTNLAVANANDGYSGSKWSNYNGSFFASTYHGGISLSPGNLTSNPFEVQEPYLNFRISSAASSLLYVELLYNGKPVIINHYDTLNASGNTNPQSTFVNATMPLLNFVCKNVSVRVISGVVGSISTKYDFIAVGDFVQSKSALNTPGIQINSTVVGSTS
jgi:hypothetical protein